MIRKIKFQLRSNFRIINYCCIDVKLKALPTNELSTEDSWRKSYRKLMPKERKLVIDELLNQKKGILHFRLSCKPSIRTQKDPTIQGNKRQTSYRTQNLNDETWTIICFIALDVRHEIHLPDDGISFIASMINL